MSGADVVTICVVGLRYSRYVNRKRTHRFEADEPLDADVVEVFRAQPELFESEADIIEPVE